MAPTSLIKDLNKCKHPNSRKTLALAKKAKRFNNRTKIKFGHAVKSNILGEKFIWFTEAVGDRMIPLSKSELDELITTYLKRFDDEIEQINLKQSISKNRSNQHASRLSIIQMTLERETSEYNGAGIELMDLTDAAKFENFKKWDGNSVNLQHLKLDRISKKYLQ
ncbi:Translation machinery-associated protein 16 like [Pseudolycoriella hygida]|uniref:Translation machinery-associated protein 16 like n=1 Tax=Pseudolycoriella hygida TaxID=35572 RepID=A0A9Q0MME3_9DIPT|nr:Translation machinery-associated protein 16 like [Pseudolycoriella hygida]